MNNEQTQVKKVVSDNSDSSFFGTEAEDSSEYPSRQVSRRESFDIKQGKTSSQNPYLNGLSA